MATAQLVAPLVAIGALALVLLGRLTDAPWAEPAAVGVVAVALLAIVGYAALRRVPDSVVARAADRGMQTKDAFSTSLELADDDVANDDFTRRVHRRAADLASTADAGQAVQYRWYRTPTAVAAVAAPAALVLALMANPQDAAREQRERDRDRIEAVADVLEAEAERLGEQPDAEAAAERLKELAEQLRQADDLDEAEELLQEAAAELRENAGDNLLAQKAASEGLQRSLENTPLPGATADQTVAEQMDALAEQLPEMSETELQEAAERLEALADTQEAGDPATADALREAAEAMRAG
ncbi:MAG TPA: hypothetical protein DCR14_08730, partial [Acidimicrobiaceae bacterium]|nr:hypothetical protein [Acidimicrobiaceae bacterium]